MSYYQTLGLVREPFSNSPDPDLLYRSKNHLECLQHMEIAVRLRRGLNVVLGEVGTGKTTLARELMRILGQDPDMEVYLLDDPYFPGIEECLVALAGLFGLDVVGLERDQGKLKDTIKAALLRKGGDGRRIVTLIVDEGQKITVECLELLRELLNFETNTHKLLQIVMFAQKEFDDVLTAQPNLDDRVNFRYELRPLNRHQTRRMIQARLNLCSPEGESPVLFSNLAFRRIYRLTGGYPRKIVRLCHMSMLLAVGMGRHRVDWGLVGRASREIRGQITGRGTWVRRLALTGALGGLAATLALTGLGIQTMVEQQQEMPGPLSAHVATLAPVKPEALVSLEDVPVPESVGQQARSVAEVPVLTAPAAAPVSEAPSVADRQPEPETAASLDVEAAPSPTAEAATAPEPAPVADAAALEPQVADSVAATEPTQPAVTADQPATASTPAPEPEVAAATPAPAAAPAWQLPAAMRSSHELPPIPSLPATQATASAPTGPAGTQATASAPTGPADTQDKASEPIPAVSATLAANTAAQASVEPVVADADAPTWLGESVTRPGWTVSRQALWVYGNSARSILAKMAKVNPGLDFDRIRAGESLTFPAIETLPPPEGTWILSLGPVESLDKGMAKLAGMDSSVPMVLFVTHQPGKGLCIEVVAYALYPDAEAARAALATLPSSLAPKARIVGHYPQGTVFFTDLTPSFGKRHLRVPAPVRRQVAESDLR